MAYIGPFPLKVEQGGTGDNALTAHAVLIGDTAAQIAVTNVGSNGQVLLGKTSGDPAFATLTSTGGTIVFTPGANSLNLEASGSTAASFPTDAGTATPALGALTIAGGNNIHTTGSGSTVTIALVAPVSIANGGTNATSMTTTDGTVIFDGTRLVTTATGTAGFVLTSNGAGVAPTYQAVSASGAVTSVSGGNNITITGTATAPVVNVSGTTNHALQLGNATGSLTSLGVATNGQLPIGSTGANPVLATITAGSGISVTNGAGSITIAATGSGGITTLDGDSGFSNASTTNITVTATNGTARFVGNNIDTLNLRFDTATNNLGLGTNSLLNISTGQNNTALGTNSGESLSSGANNTFIGSSAGVLTVGGSNNTVIGDQSLISLVSGSFNTVIGSNSATVYTTSESSNICINNAGIIGESNVLRIGGATGTGNAQLAKAFICGIDGVNVGSVAKVLTMASDQIGTAAITAGTGISVTPGANTITIATTGSSGASTFHTGSGDATVSSGAITIAGGNNISTSGSGSTVTVAVSGTTNHAVQIGNSSGSLSSVSVGTNGQVLLGATTADPSFVTPTAGTGLSVTTNATTLQYALSTPVSVANGGTGAGSITAHSLILGQGTSAFTALGAATNGQIPIGSTSNDPVLATITAGTGISVTNGAGSITIANTSTNMAWTEVTGTSASMAVNNGYVANNAGLVTLTLPSTAALGDRIHVTGKGAGGWKIAQNTGQTIFFGTSTTTTSTGHLDSSATRDTVELVCVTANNDWNVLSSIGNITVV